MTRKKKKSVLDAFLNSPGGKTLEQAAELLKKESTTRKKEAKERKHQDRKQTNHSLDQPHHHSIDHPPDKIPDHIKKSIEGSPDHSVDHHKPRHTEHKAKALKRLPDQSINHSPHQTPEKHVLNTNEAVLYYALLKNRGCFTTVRRIASVLGKSEHTMRKCLKRLARFGLVEYRQENLRGQQGIRIVGVREVPVAVVGDEKKVRDALAQSRVEEIAMDRVH